MSESFQAFVIIIIFIILYVFNILAVGTKNIQDNWPDYRCNPVVMPFASLFGHDIGDNFNTCIQEIQSSQASYLLQPLTQGMDAIQQNQTAMSDSLTDSFGQLSNIRGTSDDSDDSDGTSGSGMSGALSSITSVFMGITVAFTNVIYVFYTMVDLFVGAMVAVVYGTLGTQNLLESLVNGWPGEAVFALSGGWLCFHPDTLIKTTKGHTKMKDIKINDVLMNDTRVLSTLNISNLDNNNNIYDNLYEVPGGENGEIVYVTGSHLIYDLEQKAFVLVKNFKKAIKSNRTSDTLVCLITNNHIIPIGDKIYHDWEDKN
jgi:hypothetical protein